MQLRRGAAAWAVRALAGACALAMTAACDPSEDAPVGESGEPFLIVGHAVDQPASPAMGVNLYIQARGGNYVGILTRGCLHTLDNFVNEMSSCELLPGSAPLVFSVQPGDLGCIVQANLYALTAPALPMEQAQTSYDYCDSQGTLVTTVQVPVERPGSLSLFTDAGPQDGADTAGDP